MGTLLCHPYILCNYAATYTLVLTQYVFVSCVHRRVVEDSVVGSAVCVVHVHAWGVSYML